MVNVVVFVESRFSSRLGYVVHVEGVEVARVCDDTETMQVCQYCEAVENLDCFK